MEQDVKSEALKTRIIDNPKEESVVLTWSHVRKVKSTSRVFLKSSVRASKLPAMESLKDPLSINLPKQTRALLAVLPPDSPHASQISLASSPSALLSTLSRLLAVPSFTVPISDLFRPLLVDLCARWLHDQEDPENRFIAFCLLIEIHEELFP